MYMYTFYVSNYIYTYIYRSIYIHIYMCVGVYKWCLGFRLRVGGPFVVVTVCCSVW